MNAAELLERYSVGCRDFSQIGLREANLSEACLREIHLNGADLTQSTLSAANFQDAHLQGITLDRAMLWLGHFWFVLV
jgi:uncharacterized protein YjbI with pentapeptide repeats